CCPSSGPCAHLRNGVLEAEQFVGVAPRFDSIQHAALGTALQGNPNAGLPHPTPPSFFDGTLDEVRIWNTARSAADIRASMNVTSPSGPGQLVAHWSLDNGPGTSVDDSTANDTMGTVTGTGSSWVTPAPFDIAPWAAGPASGTLKFDGVDDYVGFGNTTELGLAQFTIETWFNRQGEGT